MMNNQNVIVYLNTPLLETELDGQRIESISRLKGKILAQAAEGFFLQVKAVGDEKGWASPPPFTRIFIPIHKIDFITAE
ncbi:MAG: hypothetical protein HYU99_03985 [Deltaproteobacteria bacterium]|nr:hypothetical protein [Deltaproteobacteria bacterium]